MKIWPGSWNLTPAISLWSPYGGRKIFRTYRFGFALGNLCFVFCANKKTKRLQKSQIQNACKGKEYTFLFLFLFLFRKVEGAFFLRLNLSAWIYMVFTQFLKKKGVNQLVFLESGG
jgi:hypothetical protein